MVVLSEIAVEGFLLTGVLVVAGWRAGHLGLRQADFVLTFLGGLADVVTLYRRAVYRPQPAAPPTGPLVAPSPRGPASCCPRGGRRAWSLPVAGTVHSIRDSGPGCALRPSLQA
ncbi:hypothetical protein B1K54_00335 [Streptomyces sp. fd1-xmd]|nr:hypothetical protein B1K54_00335 [Streptomyces sp. fd1-xmd]